MAPRPRETSPSRSRPAQQERLRWPAKHRQLRQHGAPDRLHTEPRRLSALHTRTRDGLRTTRTTPTSVEEQASFRRPNLTLPAIALQTIHVRATGRSLPLSPLTPGVAGSRHASLACFRTKANASSSPAALRYGGLTRQPDPRTWWTYPDLRRSRHSLFVHSAWTGSRSGQAVSKPLRF